MVWIIILFLFLIGASVALIFAIATVVALFFAKGVPYVSLPKAKVRRIVELVGTRRGAFEKIIDFGSGDGRVLFAFEKAGAKNLHGYEISLWPFVLSCIKKFFKKSKAEFYFKDFFKTDLRGVDIVFCYLMENALKSLKEKFARELKPGARVVCFGFEIKNWHEPEVIFLNPENKEVDRIFIYER